jgi:hypothetical protein
LLRYQDELETLRRERDLELERSHLEMRRREAQLRAEALERAHDEQRARDDDIMMTFSRKLEQLRQRFQRGLPFSPDADQPADQIPGLPEQQQQQHQQQIPVDPNLLASPISLGRIAPRGSIRGNSVSARPAVVENQVATPLAASVSEGPRTASSSPSTPADAALSSGGVRIATSSPSSPSDPIRERVPDHCSCGEAVVKEGLYCEHCRKSREEMFS